jgi:regulator of RNase E activity RraA
VRYQTPQDIVGRWRLTGMKVPITIGEVHLQSGDFVLGDRDGVVVIPQAVAEEVIAKAEAIVHTENAVRKAILNGVQPVEAYEKFGRF